MIESIPLKYDSSAFESMDRRLPTMRLAYDASDKAWRGDMLNLTAIESGLCQFDIRYCELLNLSSELSA